jgi:N-acetylglutamate synthase-like GNAT family acetyltransferase
MPGDRHPGAALIRRGRPHEAPRLRALAHRSKAHWPYSAEFLERVRPMLRLEPRDIETAEVWVLEEAGEVAGWHRVTIHGARAELEDLWLEPGWIGGGRGRTLFEHAAAVARAHGARVMEWDAEPYAEGFYRAMGGVEIGRTPSAAEEGRTLPRMRLAL